MRPGSPFATPEAELVKLPGFSKDINESREEAKKLLAEAGRAEPEVHAAESQSRDALHAGRHLPGRPVAADRREVEHKQSDTGAVSRGHERRQPRRRDRLLQPVHGRLEPRPCKISLDRPRAGQPLALTRTPELDKLYDDHLRERDPEKRKALIRAFEKRLFEQAYQQPLLWWHRIVPTHKTVMGWQMSPSHNLGADLADVWLNT